MIFLRGPTMKTMEASFRIEGFFVSLADDKEREFIQKGLEAEGYEFSPQGMKEFILDCLSEDEEGPADRVVGQFREWVGKNPEVVKMYGNMAGAALGNLFNTWIKKGRG